MFAEIESSGTDVTVTVALPVLPAASVATTVMVFAPRARVTVLLNELPVRVAAIPFTVKLVIAVVEVAVPVTVTVDVATVASVVGAVMVTIGAVASATGVWVTVLVDVAVLPDVSVATTVIVFEPSVSVMPLFQLVVPVAMMPFTVTDATAMLSDAVPETVIVDVVKLAPTEGDVIATVGKVVSSGVYVTVMISVTMLPDESVATTVIGFEPSVSVMPLFQLVVPVAMMPFTLTDATAMLSDDVPETVSVGEVKVAPFVGDVIVTMGEVVSATIGV